MFYKLAIMLYLLLNILGNTPPTIEDLKNDVRKRIEKDNKILSPRMQILQLQISCNNSLSNQGEKRDSVIFAYSPHHTIFFYTAETNNKCGTLSLYEVDAETLKEVRKLIDFEDICSDTLPQFSIEKNLIISPNLYKLVYQVQCDERNISYIAVCVSKYLK
jgi:hypothetical protein